MFKWSELPKCEACGAVVLENYFNGELITNFNGLPSAPMFGKCYECERRDYARGPSSFEDGNDPKTLVADLKASVEFMLAFERERPRDAILSYNKGG